MGVKILLFLYIFHFLNGSMGLTEDELEQRVRKMELLNEKLKNELKSQKVEYNKILNKFASTGTDVHKRRELSTRASACRPVVFNARLSNSIYPIGTTQIIDYEDVLTNVGNAYDEITGLFTAPIAGFYQFIATMWSSEGNYLEFEMVHNGNDICYGRATQTNQSMGACVAMVQLTSGDRVWVRHLSGRGTYANGGQYPSFTGHLIL